MSDFFIACQDNLDAVAVITGFQKETYCIKKDRYAALHIKNARACYLSVFNGKRSCCRCPITEYCVHMTCQDNERLTCITVFSNKHIACLFVFMEPDFESAFFQEIFYIAAYTVDACLVS